MAVFQNVFWGYQLSYPEEWIHVTENAIETFALTPQALDENYEGPNSGQIMLRCEWNPTRQPVEPIWNRQIGMMASWLGAKKVGAAPWRMAGASGLEADIVLPTKDKRRLWSGVLERNGVVLNLIVLHSREERQIFEPAATQIISSLQFPAEIAGVLTSADGLPLPPGYDPVPVQDFVDDIAAPEHWRAYDGKAAINALQAFYWREAPHYGWTIQEYIPYPSQSDLGFARYRLEKDGRVIALGILPYQDDPNERIPLGRLAFKLA